MKTQKALLIVVASVALGLGCGVEPSLQELPPAVETVARTPGAAPMTSGSPLAGFTLGNGDSLVYYLDTLNHVTELAWRTALDGWYATDVTGNLSAPSADLDSSLAGLAGVAGSLPRVYYVAADTRDVHELWYDTEWHDHALTAMLGAPVARAGSELAAVAMGTHASVFYVGTNAHLYELRWDGTRWSYDDVNQDAGLTALGVFDGLTALAVNNHSLPRVYFEGADAHLYELWWDGHHWYPNDLSRLTNAPARQFGTSLVGYTVNDTLAHVFYVGSNPNHVIELRFTGSTWVWADVSQRSGAGNAALNRGSMTGFALNGLFPYVYFISDTDIVYELSSGDDMNWTKLIVNNGAPVPEIANGQILSSLASFMVGAGFPRVYFEAKDTASIDMHTFELWLGQSWQYDDVTARAH